MRLGISVPDEFVALRLWEWNVDKPISVNMSNLATAQSKLRSTEPMRCHRHAIPGANDFTNSLFGITHGHNYRKEKAIPWYSTLSGLSRHSD